MQDADVLVTSEKKGRAFPLATVTILGIADILEPIARGTRWGESGNVYSRSELAMMLVEFFEDRAPEYVPVNEAAAMMFLLARRWRDRLRYGEPVGATEVLNAQMGFSDVEELLTDLLHEWCSVGEWINVRDAEALERHLASEKLRLESEPTGERIPMAESREEDGSLVFRPRGAGVEEGPQNALDGGIPNTAAAPESTGRDEG